MASQLKATREDHENQIQELELKHATETKLESAIHENVHYIQLSQQNEKMQKEYEELNSQLEQTTAALNSQIEKFEKFELQTRKLKKDNRILEKFMRIEMRTPQDIIDEFRSGKMSDEQLLSGYHTDQTADPVPLVFRAVSQFNLNFESNIY